jgi:hypothetical protein
MNSKSTQVVPLDWNEAKELESLIDSANKNGQALVLDSKEGVSRAIPAGLISPNEGNASVRFGTHYGS